MCVSQLPGLSRSLLGFEAPEVQKRAWVWHGSIRLCWTRRIPSAGEPQVVRSEGDGASQVGALRTRMRTGRVPGFRYGEVNAVGAMPRGAATPKLQQGVNASVLLLPSLPQPPHKKIGLLQENGHLHQNSPHPDQVVWCSTGQETRK